MKQSEKKYEGLEGHLPKAFEGLSNNPLGCLVILAIDAVLWVACVGLIMLVVRLVKG